MRYGPVDNLSTILELGPEHPRTETELRNFKSTAA